MNNDMNNDKALENVVLTRVMRLNANINGLVAGIMVGLGIFVATNWLVLKGGDVIGPASWIVRAVFYRL